MIRSRPTLPVALILCGFIGGALTAYAILKHEIRVAYADRDLFADKLSHLPPPPAPKIVTKTVRVRVPTAVVDQKQVTAIANLQRENDQLKEENADLKSANVKLVSNITLLKNKTSALPIVHSAAPDSSHKVPTQVAPKNSACEQENSARKKEVTEFIASGVQWQNMGGVDEDKDYATQLTEWTAEVVSWLKDHPSVYLDAAQFQSLNGNDYMRFPNLYNLDQGATWRQFEARLSALTQLSDAISKEKCD